MLKFRFPPTPTDPKTGRAADQTVLDMITAAEALSRVYGVSVQSLLPDWAPCHINHAQNMLRKANAS